MSDAIDVKVRTVGAEEGDVGVLVDDDGDDLQPARHTMPSVKTPQANRRIWVPRKSDDSDKIVFSLG